MPMPSDPSRPAMTLGQGMLLSAASGILLMLSWPNLFFPGANGWHAWLALIALIPYFFAWRQMSWRAAFAGAWIMGLIYFLGMLAWLRLINQNTNLDNTISWIFFSMCGAIYFGAFGATARAVRNRWRLPDPLVLALSWMAWEYVRGHFILGGWPWGSLGHTQYANPVLRQLAVVAGVGGLSFTVVLINASLLQAAGWLMGQPWRRGSGAIRLTAWPLVAASAYLLVGLLVAADAWWFVRQPATPLRVALIQGDINTRQRWNRAYKENVMDRMAALHARAAEPKPDLIVWAESCFPGIVEYPPEQEWEDRLRQIIRGAGIPTVVTANELVPETRAGLTRILYHHYNSSFLWSSQGEILGRYRKIWLVPAGEYIPWDILKKFLHAVVVEPVPVDFEPGDDYMVFELGPHRFSTLICYEDHFEELAVQFARRGADFFVAMANDGWAGDSAMSIQREIMSAFLAIEHRAYVVKADMTGPTAVIDPWGRRSTPLPFFQPDVKFETIQHRTHRTFFTRFGNLLPFVGTLLFGVLLLLVAPFFVKRIKN